MNTFEKTIKAYLDKVAQSDAVFAQKYDEAKIEGCCSYIISEVRKSGRQGFADEEIYGMAIHFFDEGLESPAGAVKCDVVVNHTIELTEEEKAQMKEKALAEYKEKIIREEQAKADEARMKEEAKAKKAAEKEKARKEEEERKRKEWETADMLFAFDEEDE
jgi:hypothetical protein